MKKLSFLLAIVLLASSFLMTSCNKNKQSETTTPQESAEQITTPEPTEPAKPLLDASLCIASEALANYEIVSAKTSSKEVDKLAKDLQQSLQNIFEIPINFKTENAYNKKQYEILIGETNREESETFLSYLKWDDYGYGIVGDKLVIAGKNEDGTFLALRAFLEYVNQSTATATFFSNADQYIVQKQYKYDDITINSLSVNELSIVCDEQALGGVAEILRDAIIGVCGIAVPIITDADVKEGDKLLIIGESAHVPQALLAAWQNADVTGSKYSINTAENCIGVYASTAAGYMSAATDLENRIQYSNTNALTLTDAVCNGKDLIPVMSFNLMAGSEGERADSVVGIIRKYRPSVIGVQEATDNWMSILQDRLGDTYTIVGSGRNADGHGEHSAILYLTEEFECLESGTKWLSDTPDAPGSQFAESHYARIMTYTILERKSDGKSFNFVNTHLDYGTTPEEEQIKVAQIEVLLDELAKLPQMSTIITGDFNATVNSPAYQKMITEEFEDYAKSDSIEGSANTYHALMGTTGEPSRIDYIFTSGMIDSHFYRVCRERVGNENVSDHYPILSFVSLEFDK